MEQWTTGRTNYGLGAPGRWVDPGLSPVLSCYEVCDLDLVNVGRRLGQRSNRIGQCRRARYIFYFLSFIKFEFYYLFRYESNSGGEREIQRTMLELLNQLDGFDSRGDVKVKD